MGFVALRDPVLVATERDFQTFQQIQMIILGMEGHGHPGPSCVGLRVSSLSHIA